MTLEIPIGDLLPNPFRNMSTYEINEEKVEELISSFKNTGFWPNIVGRKKNGKVEIAYGHHRREAGLRHFKKNHLVQVNIQDLDDADMIKMMASENSEVWRTDFLVVMENVEVVVKQYAVGVIQLPAPERIGAQYSIRNAPSFLVVENSGPLRGADESLFTASTVARFLGALKPTGETKRKIEDAVAALEYIESGLLTIEQFKGLSNKQANALLAETRHVKSFVKKKEQEAAEEAKREEEAAKAEEAKATSEADKKRAAQLVKEAITKKLKTQEEVKKLKSLPAKVAKAVSEDMKGGRGKKAENRTGNRIRSLTDNIIKENNNGKMPSSTEYANRIINKLGPILGPIEVSSSVLTNEVHSVLEVLDYPEEQDCVRGVQEALMYLAQKAIHLAAKFGDEYTAIGEAVKAVDKAYEEMENINDAIARGRKVKQAMPVIDRFELLLPQN